jgi:hypothetical protein
MSTSTGAGARYVVAGVALVCLAGFSVYTSYVSLDHTDYVTGRTFRAVSPKITGWRWRVAAGFRISGASSVTGWFAAGERATGADPHAVDVITKVVALALSAWALALFAATLLPASGVLATVALYFGLSAGAYASQGYSIYYTGDYFMIAGWFLGRIRRVAGPMDRGRGHHLRGDMGERNDPARPAPRAHRVAPWPRTVW